MAGGNQSAWGYRYQYLVTVERFLRYLRDHIDVLPSIALLIEPTDLAASGIAQDDDIVDSAIEHDGIVVERTQVKGSKSPDENKLAPLEADKVFGRLDGKVPSRSILLTNRPLGPGLQQRCVQIATSDKGEEWEHYRPNSTIVVDHRTVDELAGEIEQLIRKFRNDQHLGLSSVSCHIVAQSLLDNVFQSATGALPSRFAALDLIKFLSMPDNQIAHAVGNFDWGIPVGGMPTLPPTVPRTALLEQMHAAVGQPPANHQPGLVVAIGQTGYGKSALAAHFLHLYRNSYEFSHWISCGDPSLISSEIRRLTEELTGTTIAPGADPSGRFREALASHRGPWLIVFDGVLARQDIEPFLPTQGNGAVVITTTNATGWWPSATSLDVGTFTDDEALACFASHAGLDSESAASDAAREVVQRLGRIPLAISMAGVYFRNAAGSVGELSADYFAELDALEDVGAIPPGYDRTAFVAIEFAIRNLGAGLGGTDREDVRVVKALLYRASLVSPSLIPLNYLVASMPPGYMDISLARPPVPSFTDPVLLRRYVSIIRTQSMAQRLLVRREGEEMNEASDTIEIHPLVHEILRRLFLRLIPADRLCGQVIMMVHTLQGWISQFRLRRLYFVVDQLISHAEALLKIFPTGESMQPASASERMTAEYVVICLKLEMSTCKMGRGDVQSSVNLAREALLALMALPQNQVRDLLALKAASSILVDLCEAGMDADNLVFWAMFALVAATNCEALGSDGAAYAYEMAYLMRSSLRMRTEYLDHPQIASAISSLTEMIERDPSDELRPSDVMERAVELIDSGDVGGAVPLLSTLRSVSNDYDIHIIDCLEVDISLRRGEFADAFTAIEELLARDLQATYGARPLSRGLVGIWRTIEGLITNGVGPLDQLQALAPRIRARAEYWHDLIGAQSDGDDGVPQ